MVTGRRVFSTVGMKTEDFPNRTSSVVEVAALKAEPATAKSRAPHTPPIDIIGGRRPTLYGDGTTSVFDGGNENRGLSQSDQQCCRGCRLEGRPCRRKTPRAPHSTYRHNRRSPSNSVW